MFSNSAKYALKAVLYLAVNSSEENRIMVKDMFEAINVPKTYLAKLLQELVRHKLVSSSRGPKGGFYLNEQNRVRPIAEVINVIDGRKRLESCLLSMEDCNYDKPCPLHHMFVPSRSQLIENLERKTIDDLAEDLKNKRAFLPPL